MHNPRVTIDGFFVVDKPSGVTSFAMVSLVRRLTGQRRVGHAGTLDPLATGVLPVAAGAATRLIEYMDEDAKEYHATIRFAIETDTYDADGAVVRVHEGDIQLTEAALRRALASFVGDIQQRPPMYSAIKVAGQPLYKYARQGIEAEPEPRRVRIDAIDLIRFDGAAANRAAIVVRCGKGTYIRSLAHDVGATLGCGAYLEALRRTRSGGFSIDQAHTPAQLEQAAAEGSLDALLYAPDRAVERFPAAIFATDHERDVCAGRDVVLGRSHPAEIARAYSLAGDFLGVLRKLPEGAWHPEKVLQRA